MSLRTTLSLITFLALPFGTVGATDWDELINGDLSNDGLTPTFINFTSGNNLIEGTMGFNGTALDRDIWTFNVPVGQFLTAINLVSYSAPAAGINSFMAIDDATTININDSSQHLSNGLWTEEFDGLGNTFTPLLTILDNGPLFGGTGFSGSLGPGDYTFWVQETSAEVHYCIDFVLTPVPVPEPGSAMLLGAASLACLRRRRARK
jgi:hypothetical protein